MGTYLKRIGKLLGIASLLWVCLILIPTATDRAIASIHTYPESPTQTMFRSKQSLRDLSKRTWQAVLYKRVNSGQTESLRLRLVGFPGQVKFAHPQPLKVTTGTGNVWTAQDRWDESVLPIEVSEYDFLDIMRQLDRPIPLTLELPLEDEPVAQLPIPPYAVKEWRSLAQAMR